jgi:uncharacterized membrane protein
MKKGGGFVIIRFLVTSGVFLLLDGLWLGLIASRFYKAQLGGMMADKVNFLAAGMFYLIYVIALLYFVINPAVKTGQVWQALLRGAFFGLAMYAAYDLTNLAMLKGWPVLVTVVDLVWGAAVTAATAALSTFIIKHL